MVSPKNGPVYNSIRRYVVQALRTASDNRQQGVLHFREVHKWGPAEGEAFRREVTEQPDPWLFLFRIEKALFALLEYSAAKETLSADPVFGPQLDTLIGTVRGGHRVDTNGVLNEFVGDVLRRGSFEFNEELFKEKYVEIENAFYNDHLSFKLCMPLMGLTIEEPPR